MNTGTYSINALKTFKGMEGGGYNCNLLRDGKKVAEVIDGGDGGAVLFYWADEKAAKVSGVTRTYTDETTSRKMTPEEALFHAHIFRLPKEGGGFHGEDGKVVMMYPSAETLLGHLVDRASVEKTVKRMLASRVAYIKDGALYESKKVPADALPGLIARFQAQKPEYILLNTMPFAEAVEKVLAAH